MNLMELAYLYLPWYILKRRVRPRIRKNEQSRENVRNEIAHHNEMPTACKERAYV